MLFQNNLFRLVYFFVQRTLNILVANNTHVNNFLYFVSCRKNHDYFHKIQSAGDTRVKYIKININQTINSTKTILNPQSI